MIGAETFAGGGLHRLFGQIISLQNLLAAWKEFRRGKRSKLDVQEFEVSLEENLFAIYHSLQGRYYIPAPYTSFFVTDPKLRHIHKASVADRVIHQAIFRVLYPIFDKRFIYNSYSCRVGKGTHAGVRRLKRFCRKASGNYRRQAFALKCDIRKFFSSIDHSVLFSLLQKQVDDPDTLWLLKLIVDSYEEGPGKALPLGNVTSQLFANIYMNEFDRWVKHELKARHYLRYCDDFLILHPDSAYLVNLVPYIRIFLLENLGLSLHPQKIEVRKLRQGIDFLGYVVLPHAVMVRTRTKRRILRNINKKNLPSYLGVLAHASARKLREKILAK